MADIIEDAAIKLIRLELSPYGTNAYILICKATGDSMVIDAPGEPEQIIKQLKGTKPGYIVITHSHIDHIEVLNELKTRLNVPVAVHPLDAKKISSMSDIELKDGDIIRLGQLQIKVLHTPGHTPGSICLLVDKYLISGDTIFPGGPGKSFAPAIFKQILDSIVGKIFILPDETEVYPGHGSSTVLGKEKKEYAVFKTKTHSPDLCGDVIWLSS